MHVQLSKGPGPLTCAEALPVQGCSLVAWGVHRDAAVPGGKDGPQRLHIEDGIRWQSKHLHTQPAAVSICMSRGLQDTCQARTAAQHAAQAATCKCNTAAQQAVIPSQAVRLCQDWAAAHLFQWRHALGSCLVSEVQRASNDADLCRRQVAPKVLVNAVHVDQGFQLSSPEQGLQQKLGGTLP